ncbi:MAG TPA: M24 family metallopeptidase [Candidatus Wujingus californicus]|uniref:M24 family metallopeptidase n=1 Tax=Candidatus Wujingus californicus TaxID=3367618 RepID=UPI001DE9FA22|nr:aminopeptidase P family protein [Planctomycetota bacterium]MDO8131887.1 Xaa-Pro peptidase family protein [Candidatus Brocadiales bacterium]
MDCLNSLREKLKEEKIDGFLITNETNIRYVTGFTGSESVFLITRNNDYLFTDFRYVEQARYDAPWVKIVERKTSLIKTICEKLKRLKIKRLFVEPIYLTLKHYSEIIKDVKGIQIIHSKGIIENYRGQKTPEEVNKIKRAIEIAESAFYEVRKKIKIGLSEKDIADALEFETRKRGGTKSSFETICAIGARTSLPHACVTDKKIKENDILLIDWGARFQFYNSDLTRVVFIDKILQKYKQIYQIVLDAQSFAIDNIKHGQKAKNIDYAARSYIEKKGYGKYFGHGVGHGIGLEVHEYPSISKRSCDILKEGMIFTIEPGIYIPDFGGVRLEDMVLVTYNGCDILTSVTKNLSELIIN